MPGVVNCSSRANLSNPWASFIGRYRKPQKLAPGVIFQDYWRPGFWDWSSSGLHNIVICHSILVPVLFFRTPIRPGSPLHPGQVCPERPVDPGPVCLESHLDPCSICAGSPSYPGPICPGSLLDPGPIFPGNTFQTQFTKKTPRSRLKCTGKQLSSRPNLLR